MASRNKRLKRVYFDPKRVSSYGGVDALRRVTRVPRKIVEEWLSEQDAYTLHKPARRHFTRRRVVVGGPRQQWQADLVDLSNLKTDNDGMTFILTVIDVFTKVAWCIPLKNKSATSLVTALKSTFTEGWPKYGIHHFSTHNAETKASIVERFNRTLKTRMWRYFTKHQTWRFIDVLQDFVHSYNNTHHRSIGMTPSQVNTKNQEEVWQRLYGHDGKGVPKFRVSNRVRISKFKRLFEKGYMANWSEEMFTIHEVHPSDPPVYRLIDDLGEVLDGTFYEPELQKVSVPIDKVYRVESVLQRRKVGRRTEVLVKWYGYPSQFNSWVDAEALVRYKV